MRIDDEIGKVALPVPVMIYILFEYIFQQLDTGYIIVYTYLLC